MILGRNRLIDAVRKGNGGSGRGVKITPPIDYDLQVQPASIDLRLGNTVRVQRYTQRIDADTPVLLDPLLAIPENDIERYYKGSLGWYVLSGDDALDSYEEKTVDGCLVLLPQTLVLATTLERVELPLDLTGQVSGRSSIARLGVMTECAGYIDPGFRGQITLELVNLGAHPVVLPVGARICQLTLYKTEGVTEGYKGHYQDQEGPTGSRLRVR